MAFRYDFIGVGGLAVDLVLRVEQLPAADEKYPAALVGKLPGGFIANATCAASRLALRTGYIGWAGDDADGALLHDDFVRWGVDPAGLARVPGEVTPFTVVLADAQGRRAIVVPASPLYTLPLSEAQLALAAQARIVYTYPRDLAWCQRLHDAAQVSGGGLALDIESIIPLRGAALRNAIRLAEVVFLAESSLELLGVTSIRGLAGPGQWVIQTAGSRGVYGVEAGRDEPVFVPGRAVEVVDSTGAGDCFHAALIAARLDGADLPAALAFANAAASLQVQQPGARGGLPSRAEVEAVLL
ncbi:MAG: carbohydrate kinase family protein [Chloroflexi bacterium]|nr:carbohydrate kinase family protein [Chloroflexota bacterium]